MRRFALAIALTCAMCAPMFAQTVNLGGVESSAGSETVASSATPTFSVNFGISYMVLTSNVTTFTLASGLDGQRKVLCFKQGAGPYTVLGPAGVHGLFTVGTTNSDYNCQSFMYNAANSIWLAVTPGVINE